jgi:hypothetical protein
MMGLPLGFLMVKGALRTLRLGVAPRGFAKAEPEARTRPPKQRETILAELKEPARIRRLPERRP